MYILLFFEVLFVPLILKLNMNPEYVSNYQIVAHDCIIFFAIILLTYISYILKNKFLSILLRFCALVIYIIYLSDYIILNLFATHITINDFYKFINYVPTYLKQEFHINFIIIIAFISSVSVIGLFLFKHIKIKNILIHSITIIFLTILLLTNLLYASNGSYIHSWIYKNVIEYNLEIQSQSKEYSKTFIDNLTYNEKYTITNSYTTSKPNIILLMVESLSSYQSKLFSGVKNWTPNIDNIAKNNIYFSNFYANGFVTEDAEISLLTGKLPIYAPKIFSNGGGVSFKGFYNIKTSLPYYLQKYNYKSEFITSSDLTFSNTGLWAKSIGFDYIEGSKYQGYKGLQRYHFDAPEDKYLLQRVLQRIKLNQNHNFFMFVKTVSSHVPFIEPQTRARDEKKVIQYVDKTIGNFYKQLQTTDFFTNNGLLIIVGDHHPTMPVKKQAIAKFGRYKAPAMVPMIIVHNNIKKHITKPFQQIDITNSIKSYLSHKIISSNFLGNFKELNHLLPPKYILHKRADRRGIISVFTDKNTINVLLDGDNTRILDAKNQDYQEVIDKINFLRSSQQLKIIHK